MRITEQQELKKRLIDLLADYKAKYFSYAEKDYIEEIIEMITDDSDLGILKKQLMDLYDTTTDDLIIVTIKKIIYDMKDIQEVHLQDEVIGKTIELSNNIKLNNIIEKIIYNYLNNDAEVEIAYKNKYIIIKWDYGYEKSMHIVTPLDLYIYENSVDLINKLNLTVGEK